MTTTMSPTTVGTLSKQDVFVSEKSIQSTTTSKTTKKDTETAHYKDWPNASGFESDFVRHTPIELKVTGTIPAYAAGTLYRTGPGNHKVTCNSGKEFAVQHWFDGFSVVHRFQIQAPTASSGSTKVFYNSRRTSDKLVEEIRRTGKFKSFGFAQKRDPCQSYFKKLMSTFFPGDTAGGHDTPNVGVALTANMPGLTSTSTKTPLDTLTARTDTSIYLKLDPATLEPAGVVNQTVLHPDLKGQLSGTHAKTDPVTGDIFNYNLYLGARPVYRVFHTSATTGETRILATITAPPAYLHSLLITEHTVILCVWNSHLRASGASILWHKNVVDAIAPLDTSEPAQWFVIDRSAARRGVLGTFHTPAFFCFHTINAFEEPSSSDPSKVDIVADLSGYTDLSVLHKFYYENMTSTAPNAAAWGSRRDDSFRPSFRRYRLPAVAVEAESKVGKGVRQGTLVHEASRALSVELPTLAPSKHGKAYRFVYGIVDSGRSSFVDGLGKYDIASDTTTFWRREGHTPGEPVFVPDPEAGDGAENEDRGVLLSVVLDGRKEESYLLVLDARDMSELGRAEMVRGEAEEAKGEKMIVGFGFHGVHVPVAGTTMGGGE